MCPGVAPGLVLRAIAEEHGGGVSGAAKGGCHGREEVDDIGVGTVALALRDIDRRCHPVPV